MVRVNNNNNNFIDRTKSGPAPTQYTPNDDCIKDTKFNKISFGRDVKVTAKDIKISPGPADYTTINRKLAAQIKAIQRPSLQLRPSSREWSFAVPLSGEPFSPFGELKTVSKILTKRRSKLLSSQFI